MEKIFFIFLSMIFLNRNGFRFSSCLERESLTDSWIVRRFHDSLVRGFWGVMVFDGFGSDTFFINEFYGGAEEVVEESPFLGIEFVEEGDGFLFS